VHSKLASQPVAEKKADPTPIQPGKVKEALASLTTDAAPSKKEAVVIEEKKVSSLRSAFEQPAPKGK